MDPGDPNSGALLRPRIISPGTKNPTDDLVAWDDRITRRNDATFSQIQVGATDSAHGHTDQQLAVRWLGLRRIDHLERNAARAGSRMNQLKSAHSSKW